MNVLTLLDRLDESLDLIIESEDEMGEVNAFEYPHRLMDREEDAPLCDVEEAAAKIVAAKCYLPFTEIMEFVYNDWSGADTLNAYRDAEETSETIGEAIEKAAKVIAPRFLNYDAFEERFGPIQWR